LPTKLFLYLFGKFKICKLGDTENVPGFIPFYYYRLLSKFIQLQAGYNAGKIAFDEIYDFCEEWLHYASYANTYNLRK
jgi:hypothetical protein